MNHLLRNDFVRGFHRGLDITFTGSQFVSDVVAEAFVNCVSALGRFLDIDDCRQLFVIDGNEIHSVARGVAFRSDHRGNWMTDEERLAGCQHAIVRDFQIWKRGRTGNRANLFGNVFAGVNRHHARGFQRFGRIDAADARVRVQRTHERDVQRAGQADVINIVREAFDQSRVFGSFYSLSDVFSHDASVRVWSAKSEVWSQNLS